MEVSSTKDCGICLEAGVVMVGTVLAKEGLLSLESGWVLGVAW